MIIQVDCVNELSMENAFYLEIILYILTNLDYVYFIKNTYSEPEPVELGKL